MQRLLLLALLSLFAFLPMPVSASALNTQAVDALVKAYGEGDRAADEPGISVAVAKDGAVIYEGWTGAADLERKTAIGGETRFHIGSITKQFTAFAIHKLAAQGTLSIDQPVSDFFPELEASKGVVTIRHLLDHTGGLREVNTLVQMLGLSEASAITGDQTLALILRQKGTNFEPGTREEYSNTGYQMLAHIVAKASGVPFAEYLKTEVFDPLGMDQTFVRTDPFALIENVAVSYGRKGDGFVHTPIVAASFGSTGIVSSPRDLLRWGHWLNEAELAGDPALQGMATRAQTPDGGETVSSNGQEFRAFRGVRTWSHGGSTGGFRSFLLRLPDQGIVITVMGNREDFLKAAFAFDVAETLLGDALEPLSQPDLEPETTAQLDSYAGDYQLFPGTVFSLRREGDALTFAGYGEAEGFPLPRLSKGVFMLNPARDLRIEFKDFEDGVATQMRWQVSEDGYVPAPRLDLVPTPQMPADLGPFTGTFYSAELQNSIEIFERAGSLWISSSLYEAVPLAPFQPEVFQPAGASPYRRIEFTDFAEGGAQKLIVASPLVENLEFVRGG